MYYATNDTQILQTQIPSQLLESSTYTGQRISRYEIEIFSNFNKYAIDFKLITL